MLLRKFDFLSPPVSLYFNNKRTHTSKISGILVIIMLLSCFSYSYILLFRVLNHIDFTALIFTKFESEAGFFSMNNTQLFHFFQIFSSQNGGYFDKYDSKYIRIYTTYVDNNLEQSKLHNFDHWVFEDCREGIDNKYINKDLFENVVNFTNAACIRYYYNSSKQKYYSLEENGFIWPHLEHGIARRDNIFLTTIIEKCNNNSVLNQLLGDCASNESIEEYINRYFGFYMYLLDNTIDSTNFSNPLKNYFQVLPIGMGNLNNFIENYLYFVPVRIRTKIGELFGGYNETNSFFFDFIRKGTIESNNKKLLKIYYLMQNNVNIYERRYTGLLDILSNIGGMSQSIFYFFFTINYLYNQYIIIMDTNHFFCKIEKISQEESAKNNNKTTISPTNFKINILRYNESDTKVFNKKMKSFNLNYRQKFDSKLSEIKSEHAIQKRIKTQNFSKSNNDSIKKNNFLKDQINKNKDIDKLKIINYVESSNVSSDSFDNSNKKFQEINQNKRIDSLSLLKDKNNEFNHDINSITSQNKNDINKNNDNDNVNNRIYMPPKRKSIQDNKYDYSNPMNLRPSLKVSNLEEIVKSQKLNKIMVKESDFFEKEFTFSYFIFCSCLTNHRKNKFKNLYSLIRFRKKILSENFLFQQHIINLLLIKKSGIYPHEIKNIM